MRYNYRSNFQLAVWASIFAMQLPSFVVKYVIPDNYGWDSFWTGSLIMMAAYFVIENLSKPLKPPMVMTHADVVRHTTQDEYRKSDAARTGS